MFNIQKLIASCRNPWPNRAVINITHQRVVDMRTFHKQTKCLPENVLNEFFIITKWTAIRVCIICGRHPDPGNDRMLLMAENAENWAIHFPTSTAAESGKYAL